MEYFGYFDTKVKAIQQVIDELKEKIAAKQKIVKMFEQALEEVNESD